MHLLKRSILYLIFFISGSVFAQQPAQYSFYFLDKHIFNPAYAGMDEAFSATVLARGQWNGLEGAPLQQAVSFHFPLYIINAGLGFNVENERIGLEQNTNLAVSYAQYVKLSTNSILSIGVRGSLLNKRFNGLLAITPDGEYIPGGSPDHNDDLVPINNQSSTTYNASAGIYYKRQNLQVGAGILGFVPTKWKFDGETEINIAVKSNYFFNFAYTIGINDEIGLAINGLLKTNSRQLQTDLSLLVQLYDNFFIGAALRGYSNNTIDAVSWLGGYQISENLKLVVAYDQTLSLIKQVSNGSFEIGLQYVWGQKYLRGKLPVIIYNPRY
jgi:type IX secretion system PorP/SprF family membrane protein